jgi:hypothetical protein
VSELGHRHPCILFALGREARSFWKEFPKQERLEGSPCPAWFAGPSWLTILAMRTGVGPDAASRAADWLVSRPVVAGLPYRPSFVLCAGFAGALDTSLKPGELVLAEDIVSEDGAVYPTNWPGTLSGVWNPPLHRGRVLTTGAIVPTAKDKRKRREESAALVVEMESAPVARLCAREGIPFGCLRAVVDDASMSLHPAIVRATTGGVCLWRLGGALLVRPWLVRDLWKLASLTRLAARQLALGLGELLTLSLEWMGEP